MSESSGREVLIVEDDQEVRECVCMVLESSGLLVRGASDAETCLELLRSGVRPGLIVMDLVLPRLHGSELLERLRGRGSRWAQIPVLVLSACWPMDLPIDVPRLPKPFDVDELVSTVSSLLQPEPRHPLL